MKGLELSRSYFEQFGRSMLENDFADILPFLAVGLCGSGSECLGFDDEISTDHDFEPGFCIFLPGEDFVDRRRAFQLERAYASLPKEFCGFRRSVMSPVGGSRHGVIRTADFFSEKVGSANGNLSLRDWLGVPPQLLLEATNGEIFFDNYGEVTRIRSALAEYPRDVFLKKLAGHLLIMAQSGQYNYNRCIRHGERDAAQLAAFEFVKSALSVIFLLNGEYEPYYKWSFRAMKELAVLGDKGFELAQIITSPNTPGADEDKYYMMEGIAADVIDVLAERELTSAICGDLEKHAYSVNDKITDPELRNMHVLAAI